VSVLGGASAVRPDAPPILGSDAEQDMGLTGRVLLLLLVPCPVVVWAPDEAYGWFGRRTGSGLGSGRSAAGTPVLSR
jgi:hypothetical protein